MFDAVAMETEPTPAAESTASSARPSSAAGCSVFVRVRPAKQAKVLDATLAVSGSMLRALAPVSSLAARSNRNGTHESAKDFSFTGVFDTAATQEEVYNTAFKAPVSALFDGSGHRSVLLFCFGPSNSGKTYTVVGNEGDSRGVLVRAIEDVLARLDAADDAAEWTPATSKVEVHFVEVHNESVYDLLAPPVTGRAARASFGANRNVGLRPKVRLRGKKLVDVKTIEVHDVAGTMAAMQTGLEQRAVSDNEINSHSSRSHSIFTLKITHRDATVAKQKKSSIELTVVDLAGSERTKRTASTGSVREEAANINQSLTTLMTCIRARRETKGRGHVPFRDSMLTRILEPLLCGPAARSIMIANVSPDEVDYDEALATLKHASITSKTVMVEARPVAEVLEATHDHNGRRLGTDGKLARKRERGSASRGSGRRQRGSLGAKRTSGGRSSTGSAGSRTSMGSVAEDDEEDEAEAEDEQRTSSFAAPAEKKQRLMRHAAVPKQTRARGHGRAHGSSSSSSSSSSVAKRHEAELAQLQEECEARVAEAEARAARAKIEAVAYITSTQEKMELERDEEVAALRAAAERREEKLSRLQSEGDFQSVMKSTKKLSQKDRKIKDLDDENDLLRARLATLEQEALARVKELAALKAVAEKETGNRQRLSKKALQTLESILERELPSGSPKSMGTRLVDLQNRLLERGDDDTDEDPEAEASASAAAEEEEMEEEKAAVEDDDTEASEESGASEESVVDSENAAPPQQARYNTRSRAMKSKKKMWVKRMKNAVRRMKQ